VQNNLDSKITKANPTMYKGAGILFYKTDGKSRYVSLGERRYRPQKEYWSVPGGKMEANDNDDFFRCAKRETLEEYFNHNYERYEPIDVANYLKVSTLKIPFVFEFRTFLIDVTSLDITFTPNREFRDIKWYEINKLPKKTHIGVRISLLWFGL
jgi:8-oxo-dGTP pyrophosphatase MutT (NUDIX family)